MFRPPARQAGNAGARVPTQGREEVKAGSRIECVEGGATCDRASAAGTWGDHPPLLPSVLAQAAQESDLGAVVRVLGTDPTDRLAAALARLGRAFMARDS